MHLLTSVLLDHISRTRDFPMVLLHPMVHHRNHKTPKCNPTQGFLRSVSHILKRCFFNIRFHISLHIAARRFFKSSLLNQPLSSFFFSDVKFSCSTTLLRKMYVPAERPVSLSRRTLPHSVSYVTCFNAACQLT